MSLYYSFFSFYIIPFFFFFSFHFLAPPFCPDIEREKLAGMEDDDDEKREGETGQWQMWPHLFLTSAFKKMSRKWKEKENYFSNSA